MTITSAVYSVKEVQELFSISRNSVYAGIRKGNIPALRIGRRILIPKIAVDRMLTSESGSQLRSGKL